MKRPTLRRNRWTTYRLSEALESRLLLDAIYWGSFLQFDALFS